MPSERLPLVEALEVLKSVRTDNQVVITTMGSAREWMVLGSHPLDFIYAPSAMGQAPALGLGLALAQPQRQVLVCNGDGSMLMNLGSLVTISAEGPANLVLLVFDNGMYEVTGQQATPAAPAGRSNSSPVDYGTIARGCGFSAVFEFEKIEEWRASVSTVLSTPGPVFVWLKVAPVPGGAVPKSPAPPPERARAFAAALQA